jgi:hypothetical protein
MLRERALSVFQQYPYDDKIEEFEPYFILPANEIVRLELSKADRFWLLGSFPDIFNVLQYILGIFNGLGKLCSRKIGELFHV